MVSCAFPLPPAVSGSGVRCGRPGLGCAPPFLAGLSGCVFCAFLFFFFFFPVAGCPCPGPCGLSPVSFLSGAAGSFFFFFFCLFRCPFFPLGRCRWLGVAGLGWVVPLCLFGGPVFGALWVGGLAPFCVVGERFGGCGLFSRARPPPPFFFFFGGGACRAVPPVAFPRLAVALWLVCGVVGPSPLLAEVPVCYSPPLLAGFRCRWLWAVPATPGWGLPAAVVSGVWRWCVGGVVAGVWCGWSLATPGGGSCVLLPATPGWVSLPVVLGGPRHSWLGSVGGVAVWCVVCGGGVLVGLWLVCGVVGPSPLLAEVPVCYSPPLLAGFRCRWWWAVPATPGWGPLAAVVCGVWCVVCGGGVWVGLWLVCGVVGPSPLLAEVPVCYSPPLLAGFRFRWWWAVAATPGWGPLAALLCGVWCVAVVCWWGCGWCVVWLVPRHSWRRFLCATPRHSWLGFAAGGGGRSPPLLAGVRLRRWCVVCGVWCVAVVCWWGCGWCVVWLVPRHSWRRFLCATPRHSWLGFAAGGGGRSPPLLAGVRWRRCCVVCGVWRWCVGGVVAGVWCGWSLATPGGGSCVLLPATPGWVSLPVVVGGPRHSWLGSACGGGVWCVVCGVWRWCVGGVVAGVWCGWSLATPGGGSCVLLPATPGWVSLPLVVGGPRHSWLGSFGGGGVWCVVGVPRHSWRRVLCATPRHSWLGFAAAGGGRSPPLLAGVLWRRWCACFAWPGRAGRPPGRVLVRLTFSFGRFVFLLCLAPSGLGCPPLLRCCCRSLLAGVCGVWVGCCLAPVRVPWFFACCARSPGLWHPAAVAAWHLSVCPGCGRRRASLACLVAPRGAPRLVRSGRSRCSGRLSRRRGAFPHPGSLRPRLYWAAARGTRRPAENRAHCACRWPPPRQGRWALRVVPVRGPAMGLSLAGPSGVGLGLRALRWLACVDPVTDASGFPYRPSFDGGLGRCTGAVSCGRRHLPLRVGGRHAWVPCVFACACFPGRVGRAGLPGAFWCASSFPLAALSFCFAWPPPGWGCPSLFRCCCLSPLVVFLGLPLLGSRLVCVLRLAVGCSLVVAPPPRPPLCLRFSSLLLVALVCFFFFFFFLLSPRAPVVSGFLWFPAPGALGLGACVVCFVGLPLLGSPCACPSFVLSPWLLAAPAWLLPPPPPFVSRGFRSCRSVLCAVLCCASPGAVRCCVALLRVVSPGVVLACAVLRSFGAAACCAVPSGAARRSGALCSAALCFAVFPRAVCSVCFVVARWCVLCVPCALRSVRCCASLCWCACVVLFVWCVLLLAPGAVVRCCVLCCFLWCAVVRCWVWWPVVVCWWRVSVSVSLSGRVVCFPVLGVVCCGALLSCVVFCGAVLSRGAVVLCSAVVLRCCRGLLCPPVGCHAVLCCAVGWLCCFWPGGGVCVLWCSFPRAVCSLSPPLCALRCLVVLAVVPCFPVSCAVPLCCRVVLCCRALLSFCGAVCVCFALLRPVVRRLCRLRCCWCLVLWCVPVRCGVSLGVLRCGGAALVCRGVLLCCALSCGVLRSVPCPAVPCCPAVLCWLAVLCGCLRCWCLFCPLFFC